MDARIEVEEQTTVRSELQSLPDEQVQPDIWHVQRVLYDTIRRIGWSIGVAGGAFALGGALLALFVGGFSSGTISTGAVAAGHVAIGGCAFGNVAIGGIAFGNLALGLIAIGNAAAGLLLAAGNGAIGSIAVGNGAFGLLAVGNGARGLIAIGQNAQGLIAIGHRAKGVFVLARRGEGIHVMDLERQDKKAVDFFTRWLPRLRPALGQPEPIVADPLKRDPARTQEKTLYDQFLHNESDEEAVREAVSAGEAVVPVLAKWLLSWQPRVRARAAEALKQIGGPVVSQHLQSLVTRKYGWRDKWMWLRGRRPSQDELFFMLADIADATSDLTLLQQLLKSLEASASMGFRPHSVWIRVGMGLAHHATGEDIRWLVEPFAYYLRIGYLSATRHATMWLPPDKDVAEFLESTLNKLEACAAPETVGVLAMVFQRDNDWASRRWAQGTDVPLQPSLLNRLRTVMANALHQLNSSIEVMLNAEHVNAMNRLILQKSGLELQLALVSSAPYWGDRQTVNALQRLKGQYGLNSQMHEAIDQALDAMPARLERLRDRRTLMRTVDPNQEAMTLMRAADQVDTGVPPEQLMRASTGDEDTQRKNGE